MVAIFTRTTSVLSTQFVSQFSADKLAQTLYKVGRETGVKFRIEEETFGVAGQWTDVVNAHQRLGVIFKETYLVEDPTCSLETIDTEHAEAASLQTKPAIRIYDDEVRRGRKPGSSVRRKSSFANIPEPLVHVIQEHDELVNSQSCSAERRNVSTTCRSVKNVIKMENQYGDSKIGRNAPELIDKGVCFPVNDTIKMDSTSSQLPHNSSQLPQTKSELCASRTEQQSNSERGLLTDQKMELTNLMRENDDGQNSDFDDSSTDIDERYIQRENLEQQEKSICDKTMMVKAKPEDVYIAAKKEKKEGHRSSRSKTNARKRGCKKDGKKKYSCSKCDFFAYNRGTIKSHMKRTHPTEKDPCDKRSNIFITERDMQCHKHQLHLEPAYSCHLCEKLYKCKLSLEKHLKTHERNTNSEQLKNNDTVLLDCETVDQQGYRCSQCDYVGDKLSWLKDHKKRMHRTRFTCTECGKQFGYQKDLNRHMKNVHAEASFMCEICKKFYKSKRSFKDHLQTHTDNYVKESVQCDLCPKQFCNKYVLAAHVKSEHHGIKSSYVCPTCGRTFTQKATYMVHANVHAGIKPYVCDKCGNAFAYESSYKRHLMLHETSVKFTCEICAKEFPHPTNLRTHMKIHKDKRDYLCTVCGKEFTQKHSLHRHERIHTGDKPFVCEICQRSFTDYSVIRRHMMLMHKKGTKDWKRHIISHVKKSVGYFIETRENLQANRTNNPSLLPDPSSETRENLQANRMNNPSLLPDSSSVGYINDTRENLQANLMTNPSTQPDLSWGIEQDHGNKIMTLSYSTESGDRSAESTTSQNLPYSSQIRESKNMQSAVDASSFTSSCMPSSSDDMLHMSSSMPHLGPYS